jgi:membrane fusion protein (multidrug efflux system)
VLRPGQFVRVILRGAERPNAVTVPQRAVLDGPQGKFVYVVNEQSQAEPRAVQAGEWTGESWIITSGLKGGERVIVDGVMKLGPGAPVRVAEKGAQQGSVQQGGAQKGGAQKGGAQKAAQQAEKK